MLKYFVKMIPLASLGLFFQAMMAWVLPEHEIGHDFLKIAGPLFMMEFVFMHSEIFHNARSVIFKNKYLQHLFSIVLFVIYGSIIWEYSHDYPWIGANYLFLNIARLVKNNEDNYSANMAKFGIDRATAKQLPWVISLLKAGAVILGIPILVVLLPLPDGGMGTDKVKELVPEHNDPGSLIILIKFFAIYFGILVALDVWNFIKSKFIRKTN